jgi:hypothetical protein
MNLSDIGIKKGSLCEAIISTYHPDGKPNAAPMGVFGTASKEVILRVHSDTDTYENIMRTNCCVINIVFNPMLFLRCALQGRHKGSAEIESFNCEPADLVRAPYLMAAHAYVQAELQDFEEIKMNDNIGAATIARMTLRVKDIEVLIPLPTVPTRGFYAAVELAISLSRGRKKDIQPYLDIIKKTLPKIESDEIGEFVNEYLSKP